MMDAAQQHLGECGPMAGQAVRSCNSRDGLKGKTSPGTRWNLREAWGIEAMPRELLVWTLNSCVPGSPGVNLGTQEAQDLVHTRLAATALGPSPDSATCWLRSFQG